MMLKFPVTDQQRWQTSSLLLEVLTLELRYYSDLVPHPQTLAFKYFPCKTNLTSVYDVLSYVSQDVRIVLLMTHKVCMQPSSLFDVAKCRRSKKDFCC